MALIACIALVLLHALFSFYPLTVPLGPQRDVHWAIFASSEGLAVGRRLVLNEPATCTARRPRC